MLVIKEEIFKRLWCSGRFIDKMSDSHQKFKLEQKLVLWVDGSDETVITSDRCLNEGGNVNLKIEVRLKPLLSPLQIAVKETTYQL